MKIQNIKTSKTFEAVIKKTAQEMLDAEKKFQKLEAPFDGYVISFDREYSDQLNHVFSGAYLGVDVEGVYVFKV